jgi:hypothetical protein
MERKREKEEEGGRKKERYPSVSVMGAKRNVRVARMHHPIREHFFLFSFHRNGKVRR